MRYTISIMKFRKSEIFVFLLVVVSFLVGLGVYQMLPAQVASHWNINGEVDGYMGQFWGAFFAPVISLVLFLVFLIVPRVDPLKENIEKFRDYYDNTIMFIFMFLFYIYTLALYSNLGYGVDIIRMISPAFGALFFYLGVALPHTEPNWSLGIRTPWTLSNVEVWKKTHKLGGSMFKVCGILACLGVVFPEWAMWLILAPLILSSLYLASYSYSAFKKLRA